MSIEQLVIMAQNGDRQAYEELFTKVELFLRSKANKYAMSSAKYEPEDIFGIGCEVFMQAVSDFDPSKNTKFLTLLGTYFFNHYFSRYYRKEKSGRAFESLKSLDEPIHISENGEEISILSTIGDSHDSTYLHLPSILNAYEEVLSQRTDRDRTIIQHLIIHGMTQSEVGEIVGLKQGQVSRILLKFKTDLTDLLKKLELV